MYSDFLQRNELFNLLENNDDFTKEDVDILEEIASNPKISHKDFVNTLHKIFPYDTNHWIYSSHKALNRPPLNDMYSVSRGIHAFRRYFSQMAHPPRTEW